MENKTRLTPVESAASTPARNLINEAGRNTTGQQTQLGDLILTLPELLCDSLDAVLAGFDYRNNLRSDTAIGCRMIAAAIHALETRLQEELGKG